jgi:hypothetical protein
MKLIVITGLCGSGKTFFCKNKNNISYDNVFSYLTNTLDYKKIDNHLENLSCYDEIYLDAFNNNLIEYIKSKLNLNNSDIEFILIYTDIDSYYNIIAIDQPRDFDQTLYDGYVKSIIMTIDSIKNLIKEYSTKIIYKYRNNDLYTDYNDEEHLNNILNETKKDRLLKFIDNTSGAKNYQSIILDGEYIRKGSEQDWLTFENILKCTSLKNKIICDTGCFNGYFSFRSITEGAKKVICIDHNLPAINICKKIAIYNNLHLYKNGQKQDVSCEFGIDFYEHKIGRDLIFDANKTTPKIDIIFALNYLHHLKNELGNEAFTDTVDSFFKNSKEIIFEINENEIDDINILAVKNDFVLINKIESHRKTMFGNRHILYYKK